MFELGVVTGYPYCINILICHTRSNNVFIHSRFENRILFAQNTFNIQKYFRSSTGVWAETLQKLAPSATHTTTPRHDKVAPNVCLEVFTTTSFVLIGHVMVAGSGVYIYGIVLSMVIMDKIGDI